MTAKVKAIGQPVNDAEREAIAHLRDTLPSTCNIIHNFEIRQGKGVYEIDLAVLTPHCVFVVDIKGTRGRVDIYGSQWHPEGRQPYHSPLAKLRQHAKVLKSIIVDTYPTEKDLRNIHVHAAILMTAPDANVVDHSGVDGQDVVYLKKSLVYFQDKSHVPNHRSENIQTQLHLIEKAITGKGKPKSAPQTYREWQIEERLGGDERYTEYRAKHLLMGKRGGNARLRVYQVDPYQDEATRDAERNKISNAYRAIANMAPHPNILTVKEFFQTENEDRFILVTEDIPGVALSQHIKNAKLALTFDQKLGVIRNVLSALDHAHKYEVIHRNLTPDTVFVLPPGVARLTSFDYARVGKDRTSTIADQIVDDLDESYQAPECYRDPSGASIASDLFSAGLIFYELLTGQTPFESNEQIFDVDAIFPIKPSDIQPDLSAGFDEWLQKFCNFDPEERFVSALIALREFENIILQEDKKSQDDEQTVKPPKKRSYSDLQPDEKLNDRYTIQTKLGKPGGFGVAYKVFDAFSDREFVLKLITKDRYSNLQRLIREFRTLMNLPKHQNVVDVIWADTFPDDTPFIVFEFLDGQDVEEMIEKDLLSWSDSIQIAKDSIEGLIHLHANGVYHQDIKPSNLLWTNEGVKLIDFNVAAADWDKELAAGGTRRYMPPDYDLTTNPQTQDKIDRDIYALGITIYECITGRYPFDDPVPPKNKPIRDPHKVTGNEELGEDIIDFLKKWIAPHKDDRFTSASELLDALQALPSDIRKQKSPVFPAINIEKIAPSKPNFNPYVSALLTLYSQSKLTNAGTRGLDAFSKATYVSTLLDKNLRPAILDGEFSLAIISGNAGDGKTAFIQMLEDYVETQGETVHRQVNRSTFTWKKRKFITNYDGSQDEGDVVNEDVLSSFFAPYQGTIESAWPENETQIIAVNEGRLVDFLTTNQNTFPKLTEIVESGLSGKSEYGSVSVINLNLRSVVADLETDHDSIYDHLIRSFTSKDIWSACLQCDLKKQCYVHHNAQTFMDPVAGPKVIHRLKTLLKITHLRSKLHITIRDLRSALAFILVGSRDCDSIHALYASGSKNTREEIVNGFYFNAWMGGHQGSVDRLISLLKDIDVGRANNPDIDRAFGFAGPKARVQSQFSFENRYSYDQELLQNIFDGLPKLANAEERTPVSMQRHSDYVAIMRRLHFFEMRDSGWMKMLPYRNLERYIYLLQMGIEGDYKNETSQLIQAVSRGEGLINPQRLGNQLALRVRQVNKGTILSYRLFDGDQFSLMVPTLTDSRFLEYLPPSIQLVYDMPTGEDFILELNLDIYEMLSQLNKGYKPNVDELQGFYISLLVFKNLLSSAPYQEVLLTETGYDFHRITRDEKGILRFDKVSEDLLYGDQKTA